MAVCLVLGVAGGKPAEEPWVRLSQIFTAYYFAHFLIITPLVSRFEKTLPLPKSISEAVLAKYSKGPKGTPGPGYGGAAAQPAE